MGEKITRKRLYEFLRQHQTTERTLDVGCGGKPYHGLFPNTISLDIDPSRKPDMVGDIHSLPFKDGEFGAILCTEVLEHCIDPRKAVSEMWRVLRPEGKIILSTRFLFPIHDSPHDYFRYTIFGLNELFKEWDVVIVPETDTQAAFAVLCQRLAYQTNASKSLKLLLLLFAKLLVILPARRSEYGNIERTRLLDTPLMTSGYYLVGNKPKMPPTSE